MSKENNKRGKYNEKYNLEALESLHLIMEDKDYWMSSRQLADISGREHFHVLDDIERDLINRNEELIKTLDDVSNESKFRGIIKENLRNDISKFKYKETFYFDEQNRKRRMYLLNRESSLLCLTRYNHIIQVRVNSLFLELYDKENERLMEKVNRYDKTISGKGTLSMGEAAKTFNIKDKDGNILGRNKLFELLRDAKVLQSSKSNWNVPYQMYVKNGYFRILLRTIKNGTTITVTRITPKGLDFLHELIKQLGYTYEGTLKEIKTFVSNDDYGEEELDFYK